MSFNDSPKIPLYKGFPPTNPTWLAPRAPKNRVPSSHRPMTYSVFLLNNLEPKWGPPCFAWYPRPCFEGVDRPSKIEVIWVLIKYQLSRYPQRFDPSPTSCNKCLDVSATAMANAWMLRTPYKVAKMAKPLGFCTTWDTRWAPANYL